MYCEKLAVTMRRIANDSLSFYNGTLAQDIAADIAEYSKVAYSSIFKVGYSGGSRISRRERATVRGAWTSYVGTFR